VKKNLALSNALVQKPGTPTSAIVAGLETPYFSSSAWETSGCISPWIILFD